MRHQHSRRLRIETLETRRVLTGGILEEVSDFSLIDVNPTSKTYNQPVSPRDYLGQVSAWYFGHAT
ncbi:MAG: hypothetical protein AAGF97_06300 [Planctomycetota bacterium]